MEQINLKEILPSLLKLYSGKRTPESTEENSGSQLFKKQNELNIDTFNLKTKSAIQAQNYNAYSRDNIIKSTENLETGSAVSSITGKGALSLNEWLDENGYVMASRDIDANTPNQKTYADYLEYRVGLGTQHTVNSTFGTNGSAYSATWNYTTDHDIKKFSTIDLSLSDMPEIQEITSDMCEEGITITRNPDVPMADITQSFTMPNGSDSYIFKNITMTVSTEGSDSSCSFTTNDEGYIDTQKGFTLSGAIDECFLNNIPRTIQTGKADDTEEIQIGENTAQVINGTHNTYFSGTVDLKDAHGNVIGHAEYDADGVLCKVEIENADLKYQYQNNSQGEFLISNISGLENSLSEPPNELGIHSEGNQEITFECNDGSSGKAMYENGQLKSYTVTDINGATAGYNGDEITISINSGTESNCTPKSINSDKRELTISLKDTKGSEIGKATYRYGKLDTCCIDDNSSGASIAYKCENEEISKDSIRINLSDSASDFGFDLRNLPNSIFISEGKITIPVYDRYNNEVAVAIYEDGTLVDYNKTET